MLASSVFLLESIRHNCMVKNLSQLCRTSVFFTWMTDPPTALLPWRTRRRRSACRLQRSSTSTLTLLTQSSRAAQGDRQPSALYRYHFQHPVRRLPVASPLLPSIRRGHPSHRRRSQTPLHSERSLSTTCCRALRWTRSRTASEWRRWVLRGWSRSTAEERRVRSHREPGTFQVIHKNGNLDLRFLSLWRYRQ